jgi:glycine cleavage system H protein
MFATPIVAVIYAAQGAAALRRRATGTVDAGGARFKPGLAYTSAHTWVKSIWGRSVKVGLDDVARRILSGVSSLTLPPVGSKVRRGELLVAARCGERVVAIPCPVDGIVVERNRALMSNAGLFEREPYRAGWMLRIETDGRAPDGERHGAASKAWLRDESLRLTHFLESRLGMAAADGGVLTGPPSTLLSDDAWRAVTGSFLRRA